MLLSHAEQAVGPSGGVQEVVDFPAEPQKDASDYTIVTLTPDSQANTDGSTSMTDYRIIRWSTTSRFCGCCPLERP